MTLQDIALRNVQPPMDKDTFRMTVMGKTYTERSDAGEQLVAAVAAAARGDGKAKIGTYRGFAIVAGNTFFSDHLTIQLEGAGRTTVELGVSGSGNITRIENALAGLDSAVADMKEEIDNARRELTEAQRIVKEPFAHEGEMTALTTRLAVPSPPSLRPSLT